ncbi:MAG: hypothetical protein HOE90_20135 [Bacteriovoracaceae bacterium]|jgi:hypothetical protein|nr:hypothetical protein [Bacteriovoracaceae bacterium]
MNLKTIVSVAILVANVSAVHGMTETEVTKQKKPFPGTLTYNHAEARGGSITFTGLSLAPWGKVNKSFISGNSDTDELCYQLTNDQFSEALDNSTAPIEREDNKQFFLYDISEHEIGDSIELPLILTKKSMERKNKTSKKILAKAKERWEEKTRPRLEAKAETKRKKLLTAKGLRKAILKNDLELIEERLADPDYNMPHLQPISQMGFLECSIRAQKLEKLEIYDVSAEGPSDLVGTDGASDSEVIID